MQDEEFDNWLRANARSYNEPPAPDVEGMWQHIEKAHFTPATVVTPLRAQWWNNGWMKVAAALIIGVGLGRISTTPTLQPAVTANVAAANATGGEGLAASPALSEPEANKYLGETVALLASLQADARGARTDKQLVSGAADLLSTTRFLLDSPSTKDPGVRALLEDLELVLAQIVQLPKSGAASDIEMIHQAMEQRDVMPRLRTAVANNYSAE